MTAKTTLALLPRGGWLLALALLLIGGADRIASGQAPASGEPARHTIRCTIPAPARPTRAPGYSKNVSSEPGRASSSA